MTLHVARMGEKRGVYRVLVMKPLERPRRRWEDNINMDLQEVRFGGMGWIELGRDRDRWRTLVNAVMKGFHKMRGTSCLYEKPVRVSRRTLLHGVSK